MWSHVAGNNPDEIFVWNALKNAGNIKAHILILGIVG